MGRRRADLCLKQVCACGTMELACVHVRIRGHGRADKIARSFLRAVWPSFEGQDMLKWDIMHEDLAASVMGMQRSGRRATCCQELGLGLRASDVDRVHGKTRRLPRRLRSCMPKYRHRPHLCQVAGGLSIERLTKVPIPLPYHQSNPITARTADEKHKDHSGPAKAAAPHAELAFLRGPLDCHVPTASSNVSE